APQGGEQRGLRRARVSADPPARSGRSGGSPGRLRGAAVRDMRHAGRRQADLEEEAVPRCGAASLGGFGVNAGIVEEIRRRYALDPGSVDPSWAALFAAAAPSAPPQDAAGAFPSQEIAEKHARALRLDHASPPRAARA